MKQFQDTFSPTIKPPQRTINFARNRDPRRRQRQRTSTQQSFSLQPTALPFTATEQPRRNNFVEIRKQDEEDFPSFRGRDGFNSEPETIRPFTRARPTFRSSSGLDSGPKEPLRQRFNNRISTEIQNSLEETVRTLEQARKRY